MKIWAWGANTNGQCGLGYLSEQVSRPTEVPIRFKCPKNPDVVRNFSECTDVHPVKVAVGSTDTLVLVENAPFYEPFEWTPNFHILRYPLVARDCAVGWDFSLYLSNEGSLYSRGSNSHCQLGRILGNNTKSDTRWKSNESRTGDLHNESIELELMQVAAGLRHGIAISSDSELFVWGSNAQSQIGVSHQSVPVKRVESPIRATALLHHPEEFPFTGFAKVACGKDFTLACDQEGNLFGCGSNKYGQLCHAPQDVKGFQEFSNIFESIPNRFFPGNIIDLKCGWAHCLVLLDTGKVISWGRNDLCQLGRDSINSKYDVVPQTVLLPETVVAIACGSEHNLALGESGNVYSWGWNEHESCGVPNDIGHADSPSSECIRYPVKVSFPKDVNVEIIGAGAGTSFAISL